MQPSAASAAFAALSALLVFAAVGHGLELTGRIMDMAKMVDKKCREETGADRESLKHWAHGVLDDHESFKCYIKCIMVQFSALSEDGVFVVEEELENVPPEIKEEGHRIVLACKDTSGADACDTAYQMHRCYNSSNPVLYKEVLLAFDIKIDE
ncbi:hypothetical protein R5R35_002793 [Gryllus longicercus]|uniref:Odorant binding protein n=1 Tax=Gryllus longicercus TaxID=2509291 RepID=A0AAN9WHW9_9ORTH